MKIEVLTATMYQNDMSLSSKMNITNQYVIINQTSFSNYPDLYLFSEKEKFISVEERGLSKSRNYALSHSSGDICLLADDDLVYKPNYINFVEEAYRELPDADLIVFDFDTDDDVRGSSYISDRICRIGFLDSLKVSSVRISFKRKAIVDNKITFNEFFGSGSELFLCGEENLFLNDCLKKNLKIYYYPKSISTLSFGTSTWFSGFNEKYFITKGAISYALMKNFYWLFILQFAVRKYRIYKKEMSFWNAIVYMYKGKIKYYNLNQK